MHERSRIVCSCTIFFRGGHRRSLFGLLAFGATLAASATTYTIEVASGQTTLDAAMEAAYPGVTLEASDTVVKTGAGTLVDAVEASGGAAVTLTFDLQAGAFIETVARKTSSYTVTKGAALVLRGVTLNTIGAAKGKQAPITLAGSGTAAYPGALYFDTESSAGSGSNVRITLTDDAVVYTTLAKTHFGANAGITMNGHTLTFKSEDGAASAYFRQREDIDISSPGPIVYDGVSFAHHSGMALNSTPIPALKLRNGARVGCGAKFIEKFASVDAEYGTSLCKVDDVPTDYAISRLIGCPAISADQVVTVSNLTANAADLLAGHAVTAAGTLKLAEGATVKVNDYGELTAMTAYTAVSAATLDGTATAASTRYTANKVDDTLTVTPIPVAADEFIAYVPDGETYDLAAVTNGHASSEWGGKKLVKTGAGTLAPGADESIAAIGLTELVVADGIYTITRKGQIPVIGQEQKLTVASGGTARIARTICDLAEKGDPEIVCTAEGAGSTGANGAIVFCHTGTSAGGQYVKWHLSGDAVFGFEYVQTLNFSGTFAADSTYNSFHMNGHALTLKCLADNAEWEGNVRIRYGISFYDPGDIILDNIGFVHGNKSWTVTVKDADGNDTVLPRIRLVNGARLNAYDTTFANKIGRVIGEWGTSIGTVYGQAVEDYSLAEIEGCPEITAEQTVTVTKTLAVRRADLDAGHILTSLGAIGFSHCRLEIDDWSGLTSKSDVAFAQAPSGQMSGRVLRGGGEPFALEIVTSGSYDCLKPGRISGTAVILK